MTQRVWLCLFIPSCGMNDKNCHTHSAIFNFFLILKSYNFVWSFVYKIWKSFLWNSSEVASPKAYQEAVATFALGGDFTIKMKATWHQKYRVREWTNGYRPRSHYGLLPVWGTCCPVRSLLGYSLLLNIWKKAVRRKRPQMTVQIRRDIAIITHLHMRHSLSVNFWPNTRWHVSDSLPTLQINTCRPFLVPFERLEFWDNKTDWRSFLLFQHSGNGGPIWSGVKVKDMWLLKEQRLIFFC